MFSVAMPTTVVAQVIFFDKTEAVLSSKLHTVTYIDKKGQATIACLVGPFVREGGAPRELRLSTQT